MFFFTQILFGNDGEIIGRGTTGYDTIDAAEQAYHTAISSAISKPETSKIIALVIDAEGVVKFKRVWNRKA